MPCNDGGYPGDTISHQSKKIDKLTRMLCGLCNFIEDLNPDDQKGQTFFFQVAGLPMWWESHKKVDARRRREEKRQAKQVEHKKRALSKLSIAEIKALGLTVPEARKRVRR